MRDAGQRHDPARGVPARSRSPPNSSSDDAVPPAPLLCGGPLAGLSRHSGTSDATAAVAGASPVVRGVPHVPYFMGGVQSVPHSAGSVWQAGRRRAGHDAPGASAVPVLPVHRPAARWTPSGAVLGERVAGGARARVEDAAGRDRCVRARTLQWDGAGGGR